MIGPKITPLELYIQAGIDPKTGLPLKAHNQPVYLTDNIKKQLRIVDEQDALNRYAWYNLPYGLNANLIERILYYRGQGIMFYMEADDRFYFLPYTLNGSIDVYGRYTAVTPLPFNGSTAADKKERPWIEGLIKIPRYDIMLDATPEEVIASCVILRDYSQQQSQTVLSRQVLNDPLLDIMAECIPMMRTALINSTGVKGMRVTNEDEESNVKAANLSIQRAAMTGEGWIPIVGKLDFQDLTAGAIAKSEEFLLAMQSLDNYRLSLYGLDNGGLFQKRSHLLEAEQRMNNGNSGILLQDGLYQRQQFCDIVNSWFGLQIYCEISETVNNIDNNGDFVIDGSSDGGIEPSDSAEGDDGNV